MTNQAKWDYNQGKKIKNDHYIYRNKKDLFTAPGHHYDSVENIPNDFKVISENDFSIQSIVHKKYNITFRHFW